MTQVSGSDIKVNLYEETEFGKDPTSPVGQRAYFSSLTVSASQNTIDNPIISGGRGIPRPGKGNIDVTGAFVTTLAPETAPFWLKQILGPPTGNVYVPTALPPGFIIEKDYTSKIANKVERFNGCRVKSATFTFNQEGYIELSIDISGKRYGIYTSPLDSSIDDTGHTGWVGFQGIVKRGGTQIGGVLGGSLTIDNELDTTLYTFPGQNETAGQRFALPEGRAKISGSLNLVFQDFSWIDLANSGQETTIEFVYTATSGHAVSILIDHAEIPLTSPAIETASGMKVTYNFTGFKSGTDMGLKITLTSP